MTNRLLSSHTGFSLIEVVVVIAIAAILASLAAPTFTATTQKYRALGEANALAGDLRFARIEAIKQGLSVQVCTSSNGSTCSASTNWQTGWIVLNLDLAGNPGTVLKIQSAFAGTDTLISNPAASAITFNREGFTTGLPGTAGLLFTAAVNPGNKARQCVSLSKTGRQTVTSPPASTGVC